MSWLTDFLTALGRALGNVADTLPNEPTLPKPVPITTREELGWDEEPTSKGDKPS